MFGVQETNKYSLFSKYSVLIKVNNILVFLSEIKFIIMLLISLGPTFYFKYFFQITNVAPTGKFRCAHHFTKTVS